jgi:hypothetical protein
MVQFNFTYQGGLRREAAHGPSNAQLATDAPADNHGKGESFSAAYLVPIAPGSCIPTIEGGR